MHSLIFTVATIKIRFSFEIDGKPPLGCRTVSSFRTKRSFSSSESTWVLFGSRNPKYPFVHSPKLLLFFTFQYSSVALKAYLPFLKANRR